MADLSGQLPATTSEAAPAIDAPEPSTLVGRALEFWSRAVRDIAAGARLPFGGGDDPDLSGEQAVRLADQMRECLEARGGEVLARAQAASIASAYLALSDTGRARFFQLLASQFGVERERVAAAIERFGGADDETVRLTSERELRRALITPGMRLLTKFNALPGGMKFLVDMRADLLALDRAEPALRALDADFRHLLATWFDVGFLSRERLTWDSPASVLEKIIDYEAVHEVRSWRDLHHRLDGDRRCYAFFHPSLPKEPLIFVQVALVEGLAGEIAPLLDERRQGLAPGQADTAIFYSITNTLHGLRGISFGNFLIKQVVDDLARDLPDLKQFATLSPMPGLAAWLAAEPVSSWLDQSEQDALAAVTAGRPDESVAPLADPHWPDDPRLVELLAEPLTRAAARYLISRRPDGVPFDPVGRFHLGNGARIERLNWLADRSARRLEQSAGLMVNYLYHPAEIEENREAFARERVIAVAPAVSDLLKGVDEQLLVGVRVRRRGGRFGRMMGRG